MHRIINIRRRIKKHHNWKWHGSTARNFFPVRDALKAETNKLIWVHGKDNGVFNIDNRSNMPIFLHHVRRDKASYWEPCSGSKHITSLYRYKPDLELFLLRHRFSVLDPGRIWVHAVPWASCLLVLHLQLYIWVTPVHYGVAGPARLEADVWWAVPPQPSNLLLHLLLRSLLHMCCLPENTSVRDMGHISV